WSGDANGSSPSLTMVMAADRNVRAVFELISARNVTLTVQSIGAGDIAPFAETSSHPVGTEVSLRAEAREGWRFARWRGSVSGIVNPIRFDISGAMTVTAVFVPADRVYLALETSGDGSITASPPGMDFPPGTSVRLQALAATGWRFDHWEGDASGSSASATLALAGDRLARAVFVREAATSGGGTTPSVTTPVTPPDATGTPPSTSPTSPAAGDYPFLPADGAPGLAVFGGGTFEQASAGMESIWATSGGEFFGYVSGAPAFVNAAFMSLFSDGTIASGTPLFVYPLERAAASAAGG
ncbi:MAG: hypothetical protein QF664_08995, partial [Dehalococcoidia bacterium]|nr:hypothetical protein [Dehalococcoidia bacterium]